jgi:hypothetical protein
LLAGFFFFACAYNELGTAKAATTAPIKIERAKRTCEVFMG